MDCSQSKTFSNNREKLAQLGKFLSLQTMQETKWKEVCEVREITFSVVLEYLGLGGKQKLKLNIETEYFASMIPGW